MRFKIYQQGTWKKGIALKRKASRYECKVEKREGGKRRKPDCVSYPGRFAREYPFE